MRFLLMILLMVLPVSAVADDKLVRLYAPAEIAETGAMRHILPRFTLKTQVRIELLSSPVGADMAWGIDLGTDGRALFQQDGAVWAMLISATEHPGTKRFADWLLSDVGQNTILSFAPDGVPLFEAPAAVVQEEVAIEVDGNAVFGQKVAVLHCGRCHAVNEAGRINDIGSTPSFFVLRSFEDWQQRFAAFYALAPHGAFTQITDLTEPFAEHLPPAIVPIEMTLDEMEDMIAYVAKLKPADLGAPLQHQ
ncbi:MAG: c-type cytochrome [Pseudomonadota bacterium]